ncbi:hypothetical protein BpOF4_21574 (plasmid) [Alkalihalophilus pseudofirmus OF4]|uniref:Uncharacterized protein n=1 Tax=Alkalihalophilus pseudofirmus (strain ATCC BAA-2126 / JCM 17055 / OF4) TaxID=398511 RepID=D3G1T4_ALKPO|nr:MULTISPECIES: hypothetical protein [Alkalihalophilus]ADC52310.1 hypothetical protein BpOF4_21574 [Alkalihalophilus pseudofirmus OF4]MED1603317.1 hypothetical protein [Alkalihalophilus marmarensis]
MGKIEEKKKRKVRSDKKMEIKPTIHHSLKDAIYALSYITDQPVKDVAEAIVVSGLESKKVIEYLSKDFRRDFLQGRTLYVGDLERDSKQKDQLSGVKGRLSIRFQQHDFESIKQLAFALDVTPSRATAIIIDASIRNSNFIDRYLQRTIRAKLDKRRLVELKKIMRFISQNNPYEEFTWGDFVSWLLFELKNGTGKLSDWVDQNKVK